MFPIVISPEITIVIFGVIVLLTLLFLQSLISGFGLRAITRFIVAILTLLGFALGLMPFILNSAGSSMELSIFTLVFLSIGLSVSSFALSFLIIRPSASHARA